MSLAQALIAYAGSGGRDSDALLDALTKPRTPRYSAQTRPFPQGDGEGGGEGGPSYPVQHVGDMLVLPTTWKGTHDTSGADWNQNARTAADIMSSAGTPVGAPEPGQVVRWGSAQGGEALYYQGVSGRKYWIGHVDARMPVGTRIRRRGGRLATVSSKHPAPHVHLDYIAP